MPPEKYDEQQGFYTGYSPSWWAGPLDKALGLVPESVFKGAQVVNNALTTMRQPDQSWGDWLTQSEPPPLPDVPSKHTPSTIPQETLASNLTQKLPGFVTNTWAPLVGVDAGNVGPGGTELAWMRGGSPALRDATADVIREVRASMPKLKKPLSNSGKFGHILTDEVRPETLEYITKSREAGTPRLVHGEYKRPYAAMGKPGEVNIHPMKRSNAQSLQEGILEDTIAHEAGMHRAFPRLPYKDRKEWKELVDFYGPSKDVSSNYPAEQLADEMFARVGEGLRAGKTAEELGVHPALVEKFQEISGFNPKAPKPFLGKRDRDFFTEADQFVEYAPGDAPLAIKPWKFTDNVAEGTTVPFDVGPKGSELRQSHFGTGSELVLDGPRGGYTILDINPNGQLYIKSWRSASEFGGGKASDAAEMLSDAESLAKGMGLEFSRGEVLTSPGMKSLEGARQAGYMTHDPWAPALTDEFGQPIGLPSVNVGSPRGNDLLMEDLFGHLQSTAPPNTPLRLDSEAILRQKMGLR